MHKITGLNDFPEESLKIKVLEILNNAVTLVNDSNDKIILSLDDFSNKSKLEVDKIYQIKKIKFINSGLVRIAFRESIR